MEIWRSKTFAAPGNSAHLKGEVKMATKSYRVTGELIDDETGKVVDVISHTTKGRTKAEIRHCQNLLKNGYLGALEALGDKLAQEGGK